MCIFFYFSLTFLLVMLLAHVDYVSLDLCISHSLLISNIIIFYVAFYVQWSCFIWNLLIWILSKALVIISSWTINYFFYNSPFFVFRFCVVFVVVAVLLFFFALKVEATFHAIINFHFIVFVSHLVVFVSFVDYTFSEQ